MDFWLGPLLRILALILGAVVAGALFGAAWGWALLALGFAALHAYHVVQLHRLRRWLGAAGDASDPGPIPAVPDAVGAWGEHIATLYRLRRAERAGRERLSASLERLSQAAEALPDGLVLLDEEQRIEWGNPAAARHLGIDSVRDRGTPIVHLVRTPGFAEYLAEGGPPVVLRPVGGPTKTLSLAAIPFADTGRLLISRDITAIERADTVRRDFIANVSHEMRTPLTVIVGFLEAMQAELEATDPASARGRQLALMYDQAQRMQRLVDDLLTLSRLDENQPPSREEAIDVPAMAEALLEEGRALSAGRHEIAVDVDAPAGLRGSAQEIRSAFANLVSNAVRYTPEGGHIRIRWSLRDGQPVFAVSDDGIGIAPEHIPRLTERFYRVDRGRSSDTGGTGLGLAIVKHVLLRHGARLEIESVPGRGSTFAAVFPAERVVSVPSSAARAA